MFKFYDVDKKYINVLQKVDNQIPNFDYARNTKFVCGIVLNINNCDYFSPVSSFNQRQKTNVVIYDKGRALSSIRFCFMFPAFQEVIQVKDFSKESSEYIDLLNAEIKFCNKNVELILKTAKETYKIGTNKRHPLNYTCCDFLKLEEESQKYRMELLGEKFSAAEVAATRP